MTDRGKRVWKTFGPKFYWTPETGWTPEKPPEPPTSLVGEVVVTKVDPTNRTLTITGGKP